MICSIDHDIATNSTPRNATPIAVNNPRTIPPTFEAPLAVEDEVVDAEVEVLVADELVEVALELVESMPLVSSVLMLKMVPPIEGPRPARARKVVS